MAAHDGHARSTWLRTRSWRRCRSTPRGRGRRGRTGRGGDARRTCLGLTRSDVGDPRPTCVTRATPVWSSGPPTPPVADAVVLTLESVDVHNPKTIWATAGSLFHLPVVNGVARGHRPRRSAALVAVLAGRRGRRRMTCDDLLDLVGRRGAYPAVGAPDLARADRVGVRQRGVGTRQRALTWRTPPVRAPSGAQAGVAQPRHGCRGKVPVLPRRAPSAERQDGREGGPDEAVCRRGPAASAGP